MTIETATTTPEVVAILTCDVPGDAEFVIRGTVPIPRGTFPRADGLVPFSVANPDGTYAPTQVETVTQYPLDSDGAAVVEVAARVTVGAGVSHGTRLDFRVVAAPHSSEDQTIGQDARDLVSTPGQLLVRARDCFGHLYEAPAFVPGRGPFAQGTAQNRRNGVAIRTISQYNRMLPVTGTPVGAPTGALKHFFGIHSYLTTWHSEDVVTLELRVNNGPANNDKTASADDILGDVYFESLELMVPVGWTVLQEGPDPGFGTTKPAGAYTQVSIVAARTDGTLHLMPLQAQFHRRFALCKVGNEPKAKRILDNWGLGFCKSGISPTSGKDLWSWWNPATARYFPQSYVLPTLAHVSPAVKQKSIDSILTPMLAALATGQKATSGQLASPRLGYAHPWGAPYGGVTGGTEIWMYDGIVTAETASQSGYTMSSLTHRCYMDRQPDVLFNLNGAPTSVETWLQPSPNGAFVGMNFYEYPSGSPQNPSGPDPMGFKQIDPFQVNFVKAQGLQPPYEAALRNYDAIDMQHHSRCQHAAKVLVWLGNDPLAKDDLRMRAEIWRLGCNEFNNNSGGGFSGGGIKGMMQFATVNPGKGLAIGRALGWGTDAVNCAHAFGEVAYRNAIRAWAKGLVEALAAGQFPCNGFIMSKVSDKVLGGMYRARQQYEHAIMENSWVGLLETVLRDADPNTTMVLEAVVAKATRAMISDMSWSTTGKGPWGQLAVLPLAVSQPEYCGLPIPAGGHSTGTDHYQCPSSFAYGYRITGDAAFLAKASELVGGDGTIPSLKAKLAAGGLNNLENKAALLALSQQI